VRSLPCLLAAAFVACDTVDAPPVAGSPDATHDAAGAVDATDDPCAAGPVTTWANFGHGFLLGNCQGCHAATTPDRHGAPPGFSFDTPADVARLRAAILATSTGPAPTMPPAGGVSETDRARLALWLACDPLD
jgi:hypothetical protein